MRAVTVEHARMLNDAQHLLVQVSLGNTGHEELWGALRSAKAAVDECCKIAMRDVDRSTMPAFLAKQRRKKR